MSDTENDPLEPIDPPDNTGGGGTETESDLDGASSDARAIDPPDNTGGGGK